MKSQRLVIKEFLDEFPDDPFGAEAISRETKLHLPSVRVVLSRYCEGEKAMWRRISPGFYQSLEGIVKEEIDTRIRFHNLQFMANLLDLRDRGSAEYTTLITTRFMQPWARPHKINKAIVLDGHKWRKRDLTIQIHTKKKSVEVELKCSNIPLNTLELFMFFQYIVGSTGIPDKHWWWIRKEMNIDDLGKLDFAMPIRMDIGQDLIARVYQKEKDLFRSEIKHFQRVNMTVFEQQMERMMPVARMFERASETSLKLQKEGK